MVTAALPQCSLCRGRRVCDDPFAGEEVSCPRCGGAGCAVPEAEAPEPVPPADCDQCGQKRRELVNTGGRATPYWKCHTCLHREARRVNCKEMWGRGRRGY